MLRLALPCLLVAVCAAACAPGYEIEAILDEEPSATGVDGERGPFGVERAHLSVTNLIGGGVDVEVTLPVGDGAHETPVLLVQGGAVAKERYRWIAEHMATRGFTVLNAQHPADLAIIDIGASLRALTAVRDDPELSDRIADTPGLALGHSLGGVIASKVWNEAGPDDIRHLALLASLPDEADTFEADSGADRIVFSLWGTENGRTSSEEFYEGSRAFTDAAEVHTVTIEGMNHYQFVSDPTEDELANDGVATIEIDVAQRTALELIDRLADDAAGARTFATPPELPWPDGVETFSVP